VAGQTFSELLTVHRQQFQQDVSLRLSRRLQAAEYPPHGLGIRLEGLSVHDLHPPQEPSGIVEAYHEVTRAMERRDRRVNEALARAIDMKRTAEAEALKTVREADADAEERVRIAEAARAAFLARQQGRSTLNGSEEWDLWHQARQAIADGGDPVAVYRQYQQQRQERIAAQQLLTDFRLALKSLTDALKLRDKVILDAAQLPGKRNLLMFDPEVFRPPPPVILPPDRLPPRSERHEER
jgi:Cu+-exporting ATPase